LGHAPKHRHPACQALSGTEQAKYLESALSDAGFPISMAELASFKKMAEVAPQHLQSSSAGKVRFKSF